MPELTQQDIDQAIKHLGTTDPNRILTYLESKGLSVPEIQKRESDVLGAFQTGVLEAGTAVAGRPAEWIGYGLEKAGIEAPLRLGPVQIGTPGQTERYRDVLRAHGMLQEGPPVSGAERIARGAGAGMVAAGEMAIPFAAAAKLRPAAKAGTSGWQIFKNLMLERYRAAPVSALAQDVRIGATIGAGTEAAEILPEFPGKRAAAQVGGLIAGGLGEGFARGMNQLAWKAPYLRSVMRGGTRLVPGAEEAFTQLEHQALPSAGQLSENPVVDILQNIGEKAIGTFKSFQVKQQGAVAAAKTNLDNLAQEYLQGKTASEVGGTLKTAIEAAGLVRRAYGEQLYKYWDEIINLVNQEYSARGLSPVGVNIKNAATFARNLKEQAEDLSPEVVRIANAVIKKYEKHGSSMSWGEAHRLRSFLKAEARGRGEIISSQAKGSAETLSKIVGRDMQQAAQQLGPEFAKGHKLIDAFWANIHEVFDDRFIQGLLRSKPEAVMGRVLKKDLPDTLAQVRQIVFDPSIRRSPVAQHRAREIWERVQGYTMARIIKDAQDTALETKGQRGLQIVEKYGDTLKQLFLSPKELDQFKSGLRTLAIVQGPAGKDLPLGLWVTFGQAAAASMVITGMVGPKVLFFTVAPEMIRRFMLNDNAIRWMTIGRNAKPGSKLAAEAYLRLQAIYDTEKQVREKEEGFWRRGEAAQAVQGATQ